MGRSAASSSIDSNSSSSNNDQYYSHCRSTDLRLGLTISPSHTHSLSSTTLTTQREQCLDWPPIKHLLRTSLAAGKAASRHQQKSLFVKVYMDGIPIGRKLDLFAHKGYNDLIKTLCQMFSTTILCLETDRLHSNKYHVLTYEDQDGDWMMVGDVPWEMFMTSVKRLKITRADRCN